MSRQGLSEQIGRLTSSLAGFSRTGMSTDLTTSDARSPVISNVRSCWSNVLISTVLPSLTRVLTSLIADANADLARFAIAGCRRTRQVAPGRADTSCRAAGRPLAVSLFACHTMLAGPISPRGNCPSLYNEPVHSRTPLVYLDLNIMTSEKGQDFAARESKQTNLTWQMKVKDSLDRTRAQRLERDEPPSLEAGDIGSSWRREQVLRALMLDTKIGRLWRLACQPARFNPRHNAISSSSG